MIRAIRVSVLRQPLFDVRQIATIRRMNERRRVASRRIHQPIILDDQLRRARANRVKEHALRVHLEGVRLPGIQALDLVHVVEMIGKERFQCFVGELGQQRLPVRDQSIVRSETSKKSNRFETPGLPLVNACPMAK